MSKVLYGPYGDSGIVRARSSGHQVIHGLSYEKIKLFTMYNLFMMGASKHPFYERAQIEGNHTERLRQMILEADPGEPWRYSSIWFRLKVSNEVLEGISLGPSPISWRDSGQTVYRTVMGGICWMTFCSDYPHPSLDEPLFIGPSGRLILFDATPRDLPFVSSRIDEYFVSQGLPPVYNRQS